jgi:hypothetical protein
MNNIKIWLDDVRPAPDESWITCTTAEQAIGLINMGIVKHISFDHDLGEGGTGYDVAKHIEEDAVYGVLDPIGYDIHSSNPVGRQNIWMAMNNAWRYWDPPTIN